MADQLPTFPRLLFTIIEPISLVAGAVGAWADVDWFIDEQIPGSPAGVSASLPADNARMVALQLGNTYALVFLIGAAVLHTTRELRVVQAYLLACWFADISHVLLTCWGLGYERSLDPASWNAMTWGNVGFTVFLCLSRTLYALGAFGPDLKPAAVAQAKKVA